MSRHSVSLLVMWMGEKSREGGCWFEYNEYNKGMYRLPNTAQTAQQRDFLVTFYQR